MTLESWLLLAALVLQIFICFLLFYQKQARWEAHEVYNGVDTLLPLLSRIRDDQLRLQTTLREVHQLIEKLSAKV